MKKQKLINLFQQYISIANQIDAILYTDEFEPIVKELEKSFPQTAFIGLDRYGVKAIQLLEK